VRGLREGDPWFVHRLKYAGEDPTPSLWRAFCPSALNATLPCAPTLVKRSSDLRRPVRCCWEDCAQCQVVPCATLLPSGETRPAGMNMVVALELNCGRAPQADCAGPRVLEGPAACCIWAAAAAAVAGLLLHIPGSSSFLLALYPSLALVCVQHRHNISLERAVCIQCAEVLLKSLAFARALDM